MKDLLTKKHYCYKIHTSLMTGSAYPPSVDNPLYELPPPPSFLQWCKSYLCEDCFIKVLLGCIKFGNIWESCQETGPLELSKSEV